MSDKYLDTIFEQSQVLRNTEAYLKHLAHCFIVTGNTHLSDELHQASEDVRIATKSINDAVSLKINAQLKQSQEASRTIVNAALAGILIGKNEI